MHVSKGAKGSRALDWSTSWYALVGSSFGSSKPGLIEIVADIIRSYQTKELYDNYRLTSLYIYRTAISKSFENQVLAR